MTASQLSQDMTDARVSEIGPDTYGFPSMFFNQHVTVTSPDGTKVQRSPRYCATNYGATYVSDVLASQRNFPSMVVLKQALGWPGLSSGMWSDSEMVPFLQFKKDGDQFGGPYTGPAINAGLMLDYFNHGYGGARALNSCQLEVFGAFVDAGLMSSKDYDPAMVMAQPE